MFTQELIQNADDAGATRVVFIHDERNYGHESILTDEFGKYQGMYYFPKKIFGQLFIHYTFPRKWFN